jgi:hypothetical protein
LENAGEKCLFRKNKPQKYCQENGVKQTQNDKKNTLGKQQAKNVVEK